MPFRLIEHYDREHTEVFFGRSRDISSLYLQISDPETPVIQLLYGQTGVGKSSLIAAGLLPRLEAFHEVRLWSRRDSPTLKTSLEQAVNVGGENLGGAWRSAEAGGRPLVVFVDQVEESTREPQSDEEWEGFLEVLAPLVRPPGRIRGKIVLSFRKEWLAEIVDRLSRADLPHQQTLLNRLDADGVREVVTGLTRTRRLTRRYRLVVEPELDVTIKNAILIDPGSSAAPALQILMTRMWQEASRLNPNAPRFDHDLFRRVTQEKGLYLDDFLAAQLDEIAAADPDAIHSGLALDMLYFCTTGTGTSEAHKQDEFLNEYRQLAPERVLAAVQLLKNHKLLGDLQEGDGGRLMHDALGPFVHDRFHHSQALGQRARRILESKAASWSEPTSAASEVTQNGGKTFEEFTWLSMLVGWLVRVVRRAGRQVGGAGLGDLIDSADLRTVDDGSSGMRARTEAEERAVTASKKEANRQRFFMLLRYSLLGVFVLAAVIAGTVAQKNASDRAALEIRNGGASAALIAGIPGRGEDALQQAIQLIGKADSEKLPRYPQVLQALTLGLSGLSESRMLCCDPSYNVNAVDFSADGGVIATAGGDGSIRLWKVATGELIDKWQDPNADKNGVFGLAFSSQGGTLASVPLGGTPLIWDTTRKPIRPVQLKDKTGAEIQGSYVSVRFAHKNPWLVAAGCAQWVTSGEVTVCRRGRVTVWNAGGEEMFSRDDFDNKEEASFAEYSPSDKQIAVSFDSGEIRILNQCCPVKSRRESTD
jgi:hypothetical protein